MNPQAMKSLFIPLVLSLVTNPESNVRNERWGMTQNQVVAAEKSKPLKRNDHVLIYRDKEAGVPSQVVFEFTAGRLDQVSYVLDSATQNPENAFLTWVLDLTKRYGKGVVYLNGRPVGQPGLVIDETLKQFWKQASGEIMVIYPPKDTTYVGVGITLNRGQFLVEEDFTTKPKDGSKA